MAVLSVLSEYRTANLLHVAAAAALLYALYYLGVIIYRLYFHPLAKIPGARLGTVTWLREAYYQVWCAGRFPMQYLEDHKKYGPIIRLNPNEVHISDPEFFPKIYHMGSKFDRPKSFYGIFPPGSMASVPSHKQHRFLRSQFEPFFSRKHILSMNHTVQNLVSKLIARLDEYADGKITEPVIVPEFARALTTDAIFKIMIDNDEAQSLLDMKGWGREYTGAEMGTSSRVMMADMTLLPRLPDGSTLLSGVTNWIPTSWTRKFKADKLGMWYFKLVAEDEVNRTMKLPKEELEKRREEKNHKVVLDEILAEENLAKSRLPPSYFAGDLWLVLLGGLETTAVVSTNAIFHTLNNPKIHAKLFEELKTAFPDKNQEMPYLQLEALPYLTAMIKECLRHSDAAPSRAPRTVPEPGLHYKDYYLPPGTVVSMSGYTQHRDEKLFPNPEKFDPERFLGPEGKALEKYLIPFSGGSMGCLGKSLAYSEIYVALARLFRRYEMTLTDCDETDVQINCVFLAGFHTKDQRPVKVYLKHRED